MVRNKFLKAALIAAAVITATAASAEAQGGFMAGLRLAGNYSTSFEIDTWSGQPNDGDIGFEGGLLLRYALVPGVFGVNLGANYLFRQPIYTSGFEVMEQAVSVPLLLEFNPFQMGELESSVYEMIFLQVGVQFDYLLPDFGYAERQRQGGGWVTSADGQHIERRPWDVGIVIGAVGYFNDRLSLDVRYTLGVTRYGDSYTGPIDTPEYPREESTKTIRAATVDAVSVGLTYYFGGSVGRRTSITRMETTPLSAEVTETRSRPTPTTDDAQTATPQAQEEPPPPPPPTEEEILRGDRDRFMDRMDQQLGNEPAPRPAPAPAPQPAQPAAPPSEEDLLRRDRDSFMGRMDQQLGVAPAPAPAPAATTARGAVNFAELQSGVPLVAQIPAIFQVNVPHAGILIVSTRGDNCDTVGQIYDADGEIIAADDDGGSGTNTRVGSLVRPGLYYVKIGTYGGGDAGKCETTINTEIAQ